MYVSFQAASLNVWTSDFAKLTYNLYNLLTGRILQWAQVVINSNSELSYAKFINKGCVCLNTYFDVTAHCMYNLLQQKQIVVHYSVDWRVEGKNTCDAFFHGLSNLQNIYLLPLISLFLCMSGLMTTSENCCSQAASLRATSQ